MKKLLIPCIYLRNEKAVGGFKSEEILAEDVVTYVTRLCNAGADQLLIFDLSDSDAEHEKHILLIRKINRSIDIPSMASGNVNRLEDVKKLLYAGCQAVALNMAKQTNIDLIEEASKRFGKSKLFACVDVSDQILNHTELLREYVSGVVLLNEICDEAYTGLPMIPMINAEEMQNALQLLLEDGVCGITGSIVTTQHLMQKKIAWKEAGVNVNCFESMLSFTDFKTNADGLIPVIVQDYKTDEVLMLAYMNREAFDQTVRTGIMTYYSRSRSQLWIKGETSGHFQYVRGLFLDCDQDTLLAKVHQIGAACHTGNRSCFYRELLHTEYAKTNPLKIFESVYSVIRDRREHPKEGSYTNYLFDKGMDKILKKLGEEATEIVIAAKNPNHEEVKYEMADFLYHMMVLMVECELDWEDLTEELANR